jgi:methionyl-tRNA synthetase
MNKPFYLTTTLPYVNADPHIGFALEIIQADALVRYRRSQGGTVFYNTGTDEHGLKIYRKAEERGISVQAYCDEYAAKFRELANLLHLDSPTFIRTTDAHHKAAAQDFWKRCESSGDIYKKAYQVKYCVGCELEKTDSDLVDGKCPIHPKNEIEFIDEENYFFRFSKYQQPLLALYEANADFVVPKERFNEIKAFVSRGLEDFSISRLKEKMPWGVPVPGDDTQVMYVWFDALINYISTLGWPENETEFARFWGSIDVPNAFQVAGKDNLRQQSAMWQAMLLSAKLPTSKQIFIHGFITSEGQKMSKSIGNVVNPYDVVAKYGVDAVRHFLLGGLPSYDDGDWSEARFREWYTSSLANGVGNLTSRILTMLEKYSDNTVPAKAEDRFGVEAFWKKYDAAFQHFRFDDVVRAVNELVSACDGYISETKPWSAVKEGKDISLDLYQLAETLRHIGVALLPLIPESAEKILSCFGRSKEQLSQTWGVLVPGKNTKKPDILFPRLEA